MSICESEENRKKLAWLVPGYILLAWFFCVLFQPLSMRSSSGGSAVGGTVGGGGRGFLTSPQDVNYRVVYLSPEVGASGAPTPNVCDGNGSVITLEPGPRSAVILRLSPSGVYHYRPFNCSVRVEAGEGLDGVAAVVERMDLREHEDDVRQPGGHWGSSVCVDYLEAYTDKSRVRNKLCGEWSVSPLDRVSSYGPRQTLVGYCYDDRSGHSCESDAISVNVVLDSERGRDLGRRYGLNLRQRKGFSVVVTGYKHPRKLDDEGTKAEVDDDGSVVRSPQCGEGEYTCPIHDFSVHSGRPHCIWDRLRCDTHQNCGFIYNGDEVDCAGSAVLSRGGMVTTWSISTMTLLIVVYLAVVLVLVLVTMVLLRWHKSLRTPLDVLSESRYGTSASSGGGLGGLGGGDNLASASMVTTGPLADVTTTTEARTSTVSIIVAYRPQQKPTTSSAEGKTELPPSYESLFLQDNPPLYRAVSVEDGAAIDLIPAGAEVIPEAEEEETPLGAAALPATGVGPSHSESSPGTTVAQVEPPAEAVVELSSASIQTASASAAADSSVPHSCHRSSSFAVASESAVVDAIEAAPAEGGQNPRQGEDDVLN